MSLQLSADTNSKHSVMITNSSQRSFVSWSQLSTFRQCPLKYRFRYIDRLEPEFVSSSLLFGSALHRAIETFHRSQLEGESVSQRATKRLLEAFCEEWKHRVEESPGIRFSKSEDESTIGELAERMLAAFVADEHMANPRTVIGVEEEFTANVIPGEPPFLGIVDLVFRDEDGLSIRDYKSARSRWNQGTAEGSADQLLLYSELARYHLPGETINLEFVVLTKTKTPKVERFPIDSAAIRRDRMKLIAGNTLAAIETGIYYPNPSPMNCGGCPFRSACAAWEG